MCSLQLYVILVQVVPTYYNKKLLFELCIDYTFVYKNSVVYNAMEE